MGNLKDGCYQVDFIIYLVGENSSCSPLMWQTKKPFWLASLFHQILHDQSVETNFTIEHSQK